MSATLAQFPGVPLIRAPGKLFPVTVEYTPHSAAPLEQQAAAAVAQALTQTKKHILVFLPGAAEIRNTIAACQSVARQAGAQLLPLYGDLSPDQQDLAVAPSSVRKIICSTNVAESSVTIDGVEAVIDSGLARVLNYSVWNGLSRLQVEKISQASAIQRAGRSGRTGPGLAIRLFPESDFVRRPEHIAPEILRADLSWLVLQLTASGIEPGRLSWLDPPPENALRSARELLARLGAVASVARQMASMPVHPRLARMIVAAAEMGDSREACDLAARLSETGTSNVARLRRQLDQQTRRLLAEAARSARLRKSHPARLSGSCGGPARRPSSARKWRLRQTRPRKPGPEPISRRRRDRRSQRPGHAHSFASPAPLNRIGCSNCFPNSDPDARRTRMERRE